MVDEMIWFKIALVALGLVVIICAQYVLVQTLIRLWERKKLGIANVPKR